MATHSQLQFTLQFLNNTKKVVYLLDLLVFVGVLIVAGNQLRHSHGGPPAFVFVIADTNIICLSILIIL